MKNETPMMAVSRWTYEYAGEIPCDETLRLLADEFERKRKPDGTPLEEDALIQAIWLSLPVNEPPAF